ncbi:MAG: hypothetical protein C4538_04390 [Nitrospiraceae bacterium]|nr:MAG: hypothetical protein C4538_04390 [Nitrospiraceae bacterium]
MEMFKRPEIKEDHPIRQLFRNALEYSFRLNPSDKRGIADYIEEQILCEFIQADNLYRVRDTEGRRLDDMADMLAEGDVLQNAQSFEQEFHVHKHIGDFTLFMLGMFPSALCGRTGKELLLGSIVVPGTNISELYILQGQRSYKIASEFVHKELFMELSRNFQKYQSVIELVRTYLESARCSEFLKTKRIIGGTG